MKLHRLNCPNCNGILDMKIDDNASSVFCPYCGQKFWIDDEKKEYTINKNININKSIHNRYTDDAKVLKELNKAKQRKSENIMTIALIVVALFMLVAPILVFSISKKVAMEQGKISAGYYRDLIDQDYKTVKAHFEAAGFTDIELVDLDDAGIEVWKNDKVEKISVGGNTSFESTDFFEPDTRVVISYH